MENLREGLTKAKRQRDAIPASFAGMVPATTVQEPKATIMKAESSEKLPIIGAVADPPPVMAGPGRYLPSHSAPPFCCPYTPVFQPTQFSTEGVTTFKCVQPAVKSGTLTSEIVDMQSPSSFRYLNRAQNCLLGFLCRAAVLSELTCCCIMSIFLPLMYIWRGQGDI